MESESKSVSVRDCIMHMYNTAELTHGIRYIYQIVLFVYLYINPFID